MEFCLFQNYYEIVPVIAIRNYIVISLWNVFIILKQFLITVSLYLVCNDDKVSSF